MIKHDKILPTLIKLLAMTFDWLLYQPVTGDLLNWGLRVRSRASAQAFDADNCPRC